MPRFAVYHSRGACILTAPDRPNARLQAYRRRLTELKIREYLEMATQPKPTETQDPTVLAIRSPLHSPGERTMIKNCPNCGCSHNAKECPNWPACGFRTAEEIRWIPKTEFRSECGIYRIRCDMFDFFVFRIAGGMEFLVGRFDDLPAAKQAAAEHKSENK